MSNYQLSFAEIMLVTPFIAELDVNNGIEINTYHVDEYHDFLRSHLKSPFGVIVNNKKSYSYAFSAQLKIHNLREIKAIAIISYNRFSEIASQSLISIPRKEQWNAKIFFNYHAGLNWLMNEIRI